MLLLENLRFHPEEETNDEAFAQELAALCDVCVNDAFGTAHRAHASTAGMARFVKEKAAGFLIQKEVEYLGQGARRAPSSPFVAVLGGAKVSDKIEVLENLLAKADCICIGGAMAYTFLKAQEVAGRQEPGRGGQARAGPADPRQGRGRARSTCCCRSTTSAAPRPKETAQRVVVADRAIPDGADGARHRPQDAATPTGSGSCSAGTVFWNGPMGLFEQKPWAEGTFGVAKAMAAAPGASPWSAAATARRRSRRPGWSTR